MTFAISREQQKIFVEQFLGQVRLVAEDLVRREKDRGSPGATVHMVGRAIIKQLYDMRGGTPEEPGDG